MKKIYTSGFIDTKHSVKTVSALHVPTTLPKQEGNTVLRLLMVLKTYVNQTIRLLYVKNSAVSTLWFVDP